MAESGTWEEGSRVILLSTYYLPGTSGASPLSSAPASPSSDQGREEGRVGGVRSGKRRLADPSAPSKERPNQRQPGDVGVGGGGGSPGAGKAQLCKGFLPCQLSAPAQSQAAAFLRPGRRDGKAKAGKGYGNSFPMTKSGRDPCLRPSAG